MIKPYKALSLGGVGGWAVVSRTNVGTYALELSSISKKGDALRALISNLVDPVSKLFCIEPLIMLFTKPY